MSVDSNNINNENNTYNLQHFSENMLSTELKEYGRVNFDSLFNSRPEHKGKVQVYNKNPSNPKWKEEQCHRYHKSYLKTPPFNKNVNKSYMFSGKNCEEIEEELPEMFKPFLNFMTEQDAKYNQVVVNWYENENDYMPSHSDWTDGMVKGHKISALTLTETDEDKKRSLVVASKSEGVTHAIKLTHGQILTMRDGFQELYRHEVPALSLEPKKNRRISISFRQFE